MDILSKKAQEKAFQNNLGVALPTESRADELYERTRENAKKSLFFFATAVLKWDKVQREPHLPLSNFIQSNPPNRSVVLVPRDTFKSTIASKSFPLWILIQDEFAGIPGREHRILLSSFASANAAKQIKSIMTQVERNDTFRWLFPDLCPDPAQTTWTNTNLLFPREGMYGEDTIEAAGVDTHIVSRHYTVQIKDDMEDKQGLESPTVRQKIKDTYKSMESLFVDEQTAVDRIIGTRWGVDDLYSDIIANESDVYKFFVRPLHWTREDLETDHRQAEQADRPATWNMDPEEFAPDPTKTYFFFPQLFPQDSCKRLRKKQGSFMYSMLYLNNPRDSALAEFREQDLRHFHMSPEGDLIVEFEPGETETLPFDSLKRVLMWDPASSEKKQKNRSRNAMIVLAEDIKKRLFLLDAYAEQNNPAFLFRKYIGLHQRWAVQRAAIEAVNFQRTLKFPLYREMVDQGYRFSVNDQIPIGDKDQRIRGLLPYVESHTFFIRRGSGGVKDFTEEMMGFPVFNTKDLLDAAAAGVEQLAKVADQEVEPPERRKHANSRETIRLATRNARTGY